MKNKKICWIRVLKNISYFVIPILIGLSILSIFCVVYGRKNGITTQKGSYFDSHEFYEDYYNCIKQVISKKNSQESIEKNIKEGMVIDNGSYNYMDINGKKYKIYNDYFSNGNFICFFIDNKYNFVYINKPYDIFPTTEKLKEEILQNSKYWVYENGKVNTSISGLDEKSIENTSFYQSNFNKQNYTIYTAIIDDLPYNDNFFSSFIITEIVKSFSRSAVYIIPISIILIIIMVSFILNGIGKTKKEEGIYLNWFDKWPIEIVFLAVSLIVFISCYIIYEIFDSSYIEIFGVIGICILIYVAFIILLETIIKRIKGHVFIKNTIIYWICEKIQLILKNTKLSMKIGLLLAIFTIVNSVVLSFSRNHKFMAFIILMTLYALSYIYILKKAILYQKINGAIEQIYHGNTTIKLNEEEFTGELKKLALQVNDIAGGLSNAVEERLKSERLKTELITNVSHDIKTPLTSIINYVDLLKKEDISTEKAAEYLAILDNKSQRLKKLTEDLVEASKASSGNIKMNMEKLEVNELIKQVSAEFEDKFKARQLEEIISYTKGAVYISADSRHIYRVLENIYSNTAKYALEKSRVYTDIIEHGENVIIQIKNISKQKLNISADELIERFVRGDTSRSEEGSGLGLSIAKSLTELQNGQFHIYVDGDLFKITIGFKKLK